MKQSKLQLLRRYLKFINLSQADIKKIVFGASIFYSGSFDHSVVCPSIYGFLLPLWFLQTLLIQKTYIIRNAICKQKK